VERDLSRLRDPQHTRVLVSPMVDPYPPKEVVTRWTRRILEHLLEAGVHVMVLTKSPLVCEDYGLLAAYENVEVGFSITSLDAIYEWEPTIYDNLQRISALKWAHRHGLKTFVSLEPWILGVDPLRIIDELEPYVDRWIIGKLNYNGVPADYYRPHIPRLLRRLHATGRPFMVKKELARLHTGRNEPIVRGEGWP
jgi:DNA repair photolyase